MPHGRASFPNQRGPGSSPVPTRVPARTDGVVAELGTSGSSSTHLERQTYVIFVFTLCCALVPCVACRRITSRRSGHAPVRQRPLTCTLRHAHAGNNSCRISVEQSFAKHVQLFPYSAMYKNKRSAAPPAPHTHTRARSPASLPPSPTRNHGRVLLPRVLLPCVLLPGGCATDVCSPCALRRTFFCTFFRARCCAHRCRLFQNGESNWAGIADAWLTQTLFCNLHTCVHGGVAVATLGPFNAPPTPEDYLRAWNAGQYMT